MQQHSIKIEKTFWQAFVSQGLRKTKICISSWWVLSDIISNVHKLTTLTGVPSGKLKILRNMKFKKYRRKIRQFLMILIWKCCNVFRTILLLLQYMLNLFSSLCEEVISHILIFDDVIQFVWNHAKIFPEYRYWQQS